MPHAGSPTLDYNTPSARKPKWPWLIPFISVAGWIALIAAIACAALTLWAARLPDADLPTLLLGVLIGIVSAVLWLVCVILKIFVVRPRGASAVGRAIRLTSVLIILSVTWVLLRAGVPRELMFRTSKPAMDLWARQVLASPGPLPASARIGSYDAYLIEPIPGGVKFSVEHAGFFRRGGGFAYSPGGPPPASGAADENFTPIRGGWYWYTWSEE
jgi:hypothetical protein